MSDRPEFAFLIFKGPVAGFGFDQFPAAQRCGGWSDGVECDQPAIPRERICLQKEGDAVAGVEVGARLFFGDGPRRPSLGKTLQGLEDNMMGGVFPRQGGGRGFLLQILHFLCRKALTSKQEPTFFPDLVAVEVELPRTVPPEMAFDLHGVSERVGAGEVIFFNGKGVGLLAAM